VIRYGFFNSIGGDRLYDADDISDYFVKLISNGVFATPANAMQVTAASGMNVQVSAGWGFINAKWIHNDSTYITTLDAADETLSRIDRITLRLNSSTAMRSINIYVHKGTPSLDPVPPELTRTNDVYELCLASVLISAGAAEITQSAITDTRGDSYLCGWVTGLIDQIDTTNLFAQYNSAFYEWFDSVKEDVKSTTIVRQESSLYTTTAAGESEIPIQISGYNPTLDILNVYINGIRLVENVDYTATSTLITLTDALEVIGTPVSVEVLQSVNIAEAQTIVSLLNATINRVTALETALGGLSLLKCTQAEYDAMSTHDVNTLYVIVG